MRGFLKNFFILCILFSLFFLGWSYNFSYADTTSTLRPVADGGDDSSAWENKVGLTCDTVDCYVEINESSGSSCTNSDGNTTYINSINGGQAQTFDIDESSIPDNSVISQVDIIICYTKEGGGGGTFQTRVCHNRNCTNSGLTISVGVGYVEATQQITVSYTKDALSDVEIGVIDIDTAKKVRISQISTVITYTPPVLPDTMPPADVADLDLSNATSNSIDVFWTAPGDDGSTGTAATYDLRYSTSTITDGNWSSATQVSGEPTPSAAGSSELMTVSGLSSDTTYYFAIKTSDEVPNESGLSNVPSLSTILDIIPFSGGIGVTGEPRKIYVYFSGQAYPGGKIELLSKKEETGIFVSEPIEKFATLKDGTFEIIQKDLTAVKFFFALRAEDKDGRKSGILAFDVDLRQTNELIVRDIFFPPIVGFENTVVTKNQEVKIMGYAAPSNKIEVKIDSIIEGETQSDKAGYWTFNMSAIELDFDEHYVSARQIDRTGRKSGFSFSRAFKVSPLELPKADFNNDNKVDITDWSIFLFRWGSEDKTLKSKIDMNNDGNINIIDFSIFLKTMKI